MKAALLVTALLLSGCTAYSGGDELDYDHKSVGNNKDSFGYSLSAGNKTKVETYEWENGAARAAIGLSGSSWEGDFTITIRDTVGMEVYSSTYAGTNSASFKTQRGAPGAWTIELSFGDFTGSLSLAVNADYGAA